MSYAEVGGASAVSRVCVFEVGRASRQMDAWLLLWEDGVSVYPVTRGVERTLMELDEITTHRKAAVSVGGPVTFGHLWTKSYLCFPFRN